MSRWLSFKVISVECVYFSNKTKYDLNKNENIQSKFVYNDNSAWFMESNLIDSPPTHHHAIHHANHSAKLFGIRIGEAIDDEL